MSNDAQSQGGGATQPSPATTVERPDIRKPPACCEYSSGPCDQDFRAERVAHGLVLFPSDPQQIAATIEAASDRLNRGDGKRWRTWKQLNVTGQVVFCAICKGMRFSQAIVADVTTLNFNLMFEIGVALGLELPVIPIRDTSYVRDKRVFNQLNLGVDAQGIPIPNPNFDASDPFIFSVNQPPIQWPNLRRITWQPMPGHSECLSPPTATYTNGATFESKLADLDQDGDLDLVCTSVWGSNAAYLNNGNGYFGSMNSADPPNEFNDGCAAFEFPVITPDWVGPSDFLLTLVRCMFDSYSYAECHTDCSNPDPTKAPTYYCPKWAKTMGDYELGIDPFWCDDPCTPNEDIYEFTVPGSIINKCTGVDIRDVNGDSLPDVAFSNRNDLEDLAVAYPSQYACLIFDYFSPTSPAPPTYDFLFINKSTPGNIDFEPCVELLGQPDDGTGYGELRLLVPGATDWLDANFANQAQLAENRVIWGTELRRWQCGESQESSSYGGTPVNLALLVDPLNAGLPYQILASASGTTPPTMYGGVFVQLKADSLTSAFQGALGPHPGAVGVLDENGAADILTFVPATTTLSGQKVWFGAVVCGKDGKAVFSTNVAEVQLD